MLRAGLRRVIALAVMAFGEHGDTIDMGLFKRFGEFLPIKSHANVQNKRRCVKVKMHLTGRQFKCSGHLFLNKKFCEIFVV